MPQISVIVPVYKVESYLHRCVDSILNQTFTDFELILVDDGSPDNCGAICDEYAEKDNRIVVIHQENGGLSAARNVGIDWSFENSDSQWLTFIDSDDWVHPQYLEILYKAVCKYNSKVSVCRFVRIDEQANNFETIEPDINIIDTKSFYMEDNTNFVVAWGKLYAKECFENIRYPVGKIHEDEFVTYKILFEYDNIPIIREQLYYYFTNLTGIMNSQFNIKRYDAIEAFEEKRDYFIENGWYDLEKNTEKDILYLKSMCSIKARREGIYSKIPHQYRISKFKALKNLYNMLERDQYEFIISQFYPFTIKVQSYYFKIKDLFIKKDNSH